MKYFALLLVGFIYASSAEALMMDMSQMTNHGEFVPHHCEVWNDGCNDCEKTDSGYVCPPKNCATMRMGYCRAWEQENTSDKMPEQRPREPRPSVPVIPDNCTSWFDGCNNCGVENGRTTFCTEMACDPNALREPRCTSFKEPEMTDIAMMTVSIGPELVRCNAFRQTCMVMDGKPFDGWIDDFDYEAGYEYELKIEKIKLAKPLLDVGDYLYVLRELISKTKPSQTEPKVEIPANCQSWFDGCNTCGVENGALTFCTEMACSTYAEPTCRIYAAEDPEKNKEEVIDIVRPGTPAEVLPIIENGELIEPKASLWGLIKYHLFAWMK